MATTKAPEKRWDGGVDPAELVKFEAIAAEWWDPRGKFAPLHAMQPVRLDYLRDQIAATHGRDARARRPFEGLKVLDIGCGGGLLSEPLARLGASVTGIDPAEGNIPVARLHAQAGGLEIEYRVARAEELVEEGLVFDAVVALEVIEHVPDQPAFLATAARLVAPGGLLITSTLNRTLKALALAKIGAEYVLGWLPRGTHDWRRFVTPEELAGMIAATGLDPVDAKGFVYDPLAGDWHLSDRDLSINHVATAERRPA
ncbi:MAG: bifunctional 2-polyprenyl-6-hydroxyphenol methylase/3-demethylubiquinol 3-O-methyltransferase UbiG [Pseudomonadota bacterium]